METDQQMKFCVDCKWYKPFHIFFPWGKGIQRFAKCSRPFSERNLVTGKPSEMFCSSERMKWISINTCGPDGKFYEEKT